RFVKDKWQVEAKELRIYRIVFPLFYNSGIFSRKDLHKGRFSALYEGLYSLLSISFSLIFYSLLLQLRGNTQYSREQQKREGSPSPS
ncbi:MAG: hypothetical protein IKV40_04985, partial [Clostridia bacterium]|nr:hypothetical protein [Clostridia bacterium]